MATEQRSGAHEGQNRHDGGAPSEAPESGALGSRENESVQTGQSGAGGMSGGQEQPGQTAQGSQGEQRGQTGTHGRGGSAGQGMARSPGQSGMVRGGGAGQSGPFSLMRRISEDMDRLFEGFFGPSLLGSSSLFGGPSSLHGSESPFGFGRSAQWPEIELHQEGDRLVIQADVPGLNREDVHVEVRDQHILISGERHSQNERNEGGFYHSERSYGSFSRAIPLPENAKVESASASFENGVLRIEIEAPQKGQNRGRRIEIREGKPQ
jgi:HSP20 family protein